MVNGASFVGRVVSNRMQKTVVVAVDRLVWVPKLKVFERRTSRLLAHCDAGEGLAAGSAAPSSSAAAAVGGPAAAAASAAAARSAAAPPSPAAAGSEAEAGTTPSPAPLHVGDVVRVRWCPRLSRRKSYRVDRVLRRARVYSPTLGERALEEHRARRAAEEAGGEAGGGAGQEAAAGGARVARAEAALEVARRRLAALRQEAAAGAGASS